MRGAFFPLRFLKLPLDLPSRSFHNEIRDHQRRSGQWPRQGRHRQQHRRRAQSLWPSRHFHQNRFSLSLNFFSLLPFSLHRLAVTFNFHADPYLNIDAGTMSPFEHGEVFVLDDGGEVRFLLPVFLFFLVIPLHALILTLPRWRRIDFYILYFDSSVIG